MKKINYALTSVVIFLTPALINASAIGNDIDDNRIEVVLYILLIISPIAIIAIIANILLNRGKRIIFLKTKEPKKDANGKEITTKNKTTRKQLPKEKTKKSEADLLIEKTLLSNPKIETIVSKEKKEDKKIFKLDFRNDERIIERNQVEIYSEQKEEYVSYIIVVTNIRLGILKADETLHLAVPLKELETITNKEADIYEYKFNNNRKIKIKSKRLYNNLKDRIESKGK